MQMNILAGSPFNLQNDAAWQAWRAEKLASLPGSIDEMRVHLADPCRPSARELAALTGKARRHNWALFATNPAAMTDENCLKQLCESIGLVHLDRNLRADDTGISSIQVKQQQGTAYIPYTDRQLSWHTDGYYNETDRQIHGWALYCVRQAAEGGESQLMDHEMAYIMIRDEDPAMIRALMQPGAMTIPANREEGDEIRPDHSGPVFSVTPSGHLHMRYSARKRNIIWKDDADTLKARDFITALFRDESAPIYTYTLKPGEGVVSNNILHRRNAFTDGDTPDRKRLVWRARFHDRISNTTATE
jgi:alpha-ketoglutarate-dependent taurine dioxygenase